MARRKLRPHVDSGVNQASEFVERGKPPATPSADSFLRAKETSIGPLESYIARLPLPYKACFFIQHSFIVELWQQFETAIADFRVPGTHKNLHSLDLPIAR